MKGWLLDTNVLSEWTRPRPNVRVVQFVVSQPLDLLFISVVTLAEVRFGIEMQRDAGRRMELNDWLEHKMRPMFDGRVLDLNEDIVLKWRLLVEEGRKKGHTFGEPDVLIAATAIHHGLTIVSRDTREFEIAGVPVLNPWNR